MQAKARLIQPGMKLTSINREKIARLKNADLIDLHDRLHELYQLGMTLGDDEICQRAKQAHRHYVYEMLQRSISHPYIDTMDDSTHVTEAMEDDDVGEDASTNELDYSDSLMLAFEMPSEIGEKIAMKGGEPNDELHLTLIYLGKVDDWTQEQLDVLPGLASVYAANSKPLHGHVSGMGRFAASVSSDNQDVLYYSVDMPDLPAWRQGLVEWLADGGFRVQSEHGYTPHVTVKYIARDEPYTMTAMQPLALECKELLCKIGEKRYHFPLASLYAMKPSSWTDKLLESQERLHESRHLLSDQVRRPDVTTRGGMRSSDDDFWIDVPMEKGHDEETVTGKSIPIEGPQIIYGVLLVPDEDDLEGDRFPANIVAKACEKYSAKLKADEQHRFANPNLEVVDSFIAPEQYAINGNPVKQGSWVVGIRTSDPDVIAKVRSGDYRGLSIEGTAVMKNQENSEYLLQN